MESLRFKPSGFWRLDDSTPFQDYSGYNRTGTLTGTEVKGLALHPDAGYSQLFDATHTGLFDAPVYRQGRETEPFSMVATVYPVAGTAGPVSILSKVSRKDGIYLDGTTIYFATEYSDSSKALCSFDMEAVKKANIVGVHTEAKNSLFVNGVLVDEVDISETQRGLSYFSSGTDLTAGPATGTQKVYANNFAVYSRALQTEDVKRLHDAANRVAPGDTAKMFGGESIPLGLTTRAPYLSVDWNSDEDWDAGVKTQVDPEDGILWCSKSNDLTLGGEWLTSVDLYDGDTAVPINCAYLDWEGENETVEVSLDGTTWTAVTRATKISIISTDFIPTTESLNIKVKFPVGVEDAYIANLRAYAFTGNTAVSNNRVITYPASAIVRNDYLTPQITDDWGVNLEAGTLTIGPDLVSGTPMGVRTIEVWLLKDGSTLTISGSPSNSYTNGILSGTFLNGEWVVRHFTFAADFTGTLTITGDVQIGKVAVYPTVLSATEVAAIVSNYTGVQKVVTDGTGTITIAETATPVEIYSHDWEIQSS